MTPPETDTAPAAPGGPSRPDLRTGLLILVTVILAGWALRAMAVVMVPLVAAILTALAVMPVRDWVRVRMPSRLRWMGIVAAMGVVILVLGIFFGGLYLAGRQLAGKVPEAAEQITGMLTEDAAAGGGRPGADNGGGSDSVAQGAREGAQEQQADQLQGDDATAVPDAGPALREETAGTEPGPASAATPEAGDEAAAGEGGGGLSIPTSPREVLQRGGDQLLGAAGGAVSVIMNSALSILGGLVIVFFLTLLILLESGDWAKKAERIAGLRAEWRLLETTDVVASKFRSYVLLQAGFGATTGVLYAIWLGFWDVDLILVWALLSFLMNFIPNVGSIISGGTTTAYALITKDVGTGLIVGAGILAIEQVMGNIVAPQLQGKNIALSPLVVLVALLFWGWTWGVAGALLAVPVTFAIVVMMSHVPALRPWALLLTDQTDMAGLDEATRPG